MGKGGSIMKTYDFTVTVTTSCYGYEADSNEEAIEKVKQDWLETYNLELTDDEITIDSVEEVA
jgi:hypothetical protein